MAGLVEEMGDLFNARGHRALQDGRLPAALDLLGCAVAVFEDLGLPEPEIMARENIYLTLRAGQRYDAAFDLLERLVDRHTAERTPALRQYVAEILDADQAFREMGDPLLVRADHLDEDATRHLAEHGEEVVRARRFLVIEKNQDVLEVFGHPAPERRAALVEHARRLQSEA